jgi:septum formation protein
MSARKKALQKNNLWKLKQDFILASGSPQRLRLLGCAGFHPTEIITADVDETPLPKELPARYVHRIAVKKAMAVAELKPNTCILGADTVIAVGKRIIRKAKTKEEAKQNLKLLSGRRSRVITGFCVITPTGKQIAKVVQTTVEIKNMDSADIQAVLDSGEWKNVAGYRIEGVLSACVRKIIGSHPNIVGLPIFEVAQVLKGVLRQE